MRKKDFERIERYTDASGYMRAEWDRPPLAQDD
jgi:hypothetical protein